MARDVEPLTAAQEQLFVEYMPWAESGANLFHQRLKGRCEFDDLRSVAYEGLLHAVRRFEPERGWVFKTYAFRCINGYLLRENERQKRQNGWGYRKSGGQTRTMVQHQVRCAWPASEDGTQIDLPAPAPSIERDALFALARRRLLRHQTDPRDEKIVRAILDNKTLRDIAHELDLSHERVRQLINRISARSAQRAQDQGVA